MHGERPFTRNAQSGFSLIELLIVLVITMVVSAAILQVITESMRHSSREQARLDVFQEAREFMDQMARDLHEAGYPNPRNFTATGVLTVVPIANDQRAAVGLVKVGSGDLWFEGDVDGTGVVSVVRYHLDSTGNNCPCLRRSQKNKVAANPLTGQPEEYQVEVQNVQNTTIFSAFTRGAIGTPITLPVDFASNAFTLAEIDTIQAVLTVQSPYVDPKTKKRPVATLISTVRLNNCSQASVGLAMSCQ